MNITLRVFASIRDICGFDEKKIQLQADATVDQLIDLLVREYSGLEAKRGSLLIAVNEEYSTGSMKLSDSDIVALFPPVSGG